MTHRQDEPSPVHQPTRILLRPRHQGPEQKRAFDRTSTQREVRARVEDSGEALSAKLLNISPSGLQLALPCAFSEGAHLEVEALPERLLSAVVKWSKPAEDHFVIGAEWDEPITIEEVWQVRALDAT